MSHTARPSAHRSIIVLTACAALMALMAGLLVTVATPASAASREPACSGWLFTKDCSKRDWYRDVRTELSSGDYNRAASATLAVFGPYMATSRAGNLVPSALEITRQAGATRAQTQCVGAATLEMAFVIAQSDADVRKLREVFKLAKSVAGKAGRGVPVVSLVKAYLTAGGKTLTSARKASLNSRSSQIADTLLICAA